MPMPEDRFSNDVAGAAAYERERSRRDDPRDDDYDRAAPRRYRCTCTAISESQCDYCCGEYYKQPEPEPTLEERWREAFGECMPGEHFFNTYRDEETGEKFVFCVDCFSLADDLPPGDRPMAMPDMDEPYQDEGPTCSICDGVGHGYPGGGPCPLEVNDRCRDETEEDDRRGGL